MFEKNMQLSFLLDFYGDVLDERIRSVMTAYFNDDLSLAEIAQGEGISRQGVRHLIKKGEQTLWFFEQKLGLAAHYRELSVIAEGLNRLAEELEQTDSAHAARILHEAATAILTKGV